MQHKPIELTKINLKHKKLYKMETLKKIITKIITSKKFWYASAMFIFITCSSTFGITEGEMSNLILVGIALIISQGIADCRNCKK